MCKTGNFILFYVYENHMVYLLFRVSFDTLMLKNKKSKSNKYNIIMGPMPSVAMPKKVYRPHVLRRLFGKIHMYCWEDYLGI
jgi:hypothetical protein